MCQYHSMRGNTGDRDTYLSRKHSQCRVSHWIICVLAQSRLLAERAQSISGLSRIANECSLPWIESVREEKQLFCLCHRSQRCQFRTRESSAPEACCDELMTAFCCYIAARIETSVVHSRGYLQQNSCVEYVSCKNWGCGFTPL